MTPEEAIALDPGTTPGPWKLLYRDTHPNAIPTNVVIGEDEEALATYDDGYGGDPEWANPGGDLPMIAAAPDMRATIAGMHEEWCVEADGNTLFPINEEQHPNGEYFTERRADAEAVRDRMAKLNPHIHYRLVRRLVGEVEVVEE